jgi:serine/threonine protein kinase
MTDPGVEEHERTPECKEEDRHDQETTTEPSRTVGRVETEQSKTTSTHNESKANATGSAGTGNSKETAVKDSSREKKVSEKDNQRIDETRGEVPAGPVAIEEEVLLSENPLRCPRTGLITDLDGFEDMGELGSSRFGTVSLLRRRNSDGTFELFAAKAYNLGDNREGRQAFDDRMKRLLKLSHRHVMPIVGVIPPTKESGPILFTRYSEIGSLESVLSAVLLNSPPPFWTESTKLGLIVSLMSGLNYFHKNGIVHRELKPNDLIIEADGSLRICGYATSILEEHKYTKASQVSDPFYMAPEIYDDEREGKKTRDPKTDVFLFGLILYEILTGQKVFASTISIAAIMRKALSDGPRDRPMIPSKVHKILQEVICRKLISQG